MAQEDGDVPHEPPIRITPEEAARAVPPPPRPRFVQAPPPTAPRPRLSRLAVAAFILGLLGLPLTFLVGAAALIAGALGLVAVHGNPDLRGRKLALAGLLLGVVSFVGWSFALWHFLGLPGSRPPEGPPRLLESAGSAPPPALRSAPEPYRSALLANVVVQGSGGGARWSGSGVVVDREGDILRIVTNRHVAEGPGGREGPGLLSILLSTGESAAASTVWRAASGVDLCVLELRASSAKDIEAVAPRAKAVQVADEVFAVGNPMEFRWSLTKGVVSSVRQVMSGSTALKVYQTQTPISSGNSGGGLYNREGHLVGINTWSVDKTLSEGLGFSISVETLLEHLEKAPFAWAARLLKEARK